MTRPQQGRGGYQHDDAPKFQKPSNETFEAIIGKGNPEKLIEEAERVGKALADAKLTTSQIRNIFGTARQIQMRWSKAGSDTESKSYKDAVLLRPKMHYLAKRAEKGKKAEGMVILQEVLEPALQRISENGKPNFDRYNNFMDFFEAIVAYHAKHGGKAS